MKQKWAAILLMSTFHLSSSTPVNNGHMFSTGSFNGDHPFRTENDFIDRKADDSSEEKDVHDSESISSCQQPSCVTRECLGVAHRVLSYMNDTVDPCDDFYQFSCGRYISETVIPSDKGSWTSFNPIGEEIYSRGRSLLESAAEPGDFNSYQLIRAHYRSCTDEEQLEKLGTEPMRKLLKEVGGWPVLEGSQWAGEKEFQWWDWAYKMNMIGFGIDDIVSVSIGSDDRNTSWRVIGLDQPTLGLSREYLTKGFDDVDVQHYFTFMVQTAILLGADPDRAHAEMRESLMFEIDLAEITAPREERRNAELLYNPTTLGELPVYDEMPPSWTEYFQNLFEGTKIKIQDAEKVVITNKEFHGKLSNLLKKTEKRVLANYLGWKAVKTVMGYLNKAARDISHKFSKALTGVQEAAPTWKRCVSEMGFNSFSAGGFGFVAGSMYVKKYFNKEAKNEMIEMTNYIRTAFREDILEKLDWMDDATKKRALNKLNKMEQFIAFSDEFLIQDKVDGLHKDIEVSEDDYLGNTLKLIRFWRKFYYNQLRDKIDTKSWIEHSLVTVVNAFYNPSQNNMEFPAGILQGNFFNADVPKYLNFGGIGSVIGHEITHGFDDQGKQRNEIGEIENWWDPKTERQYQEKAQCIIDQYSNFEAKQIGLKLNGINGQGENIADNGGVKESYKAYLRWVLDNGQELSLPGLNYTPRQMFWIAFGQVWCAKYRDGSLKQQVLTGYHSPGEFRVVGTLSNNDDFARDFQCAKGSRMNPENKCVVW